MSDVKHIIFTGFYTQVDLDGSGTVDPQPPETFRLLTESGDNIITESGNYLNIENNG